MEIRCLKDATTFAQIRSRVA
jgi:hypothetical protein